MSHRSAKFASAILASFLASAALPAISYSAEPATDDCLSGPKDQTPEGSHWFYRIDRPTDRRCWYLRPWSVGASPAPATETQRTTARSPAAQTAPRTRPPLSESDQAALFLEFLRWKEQQKTAP